LRWAADDRGSEIVDVRQSRSGFERYGKGGDNAKLKDWASTTLPTLQHHLDMAQSLYKNT
jgi:putative membrane protein